MNGWRNGRNGRNLSVNRSIDGWMHVRIWRMMRADEPVNKTKGCGRM